MKVFKLIVEVYVRADDAEEAEQIVADEFDYLFGCDNPLSAFEFKYRSAEEQGDDDAV